ncbi:MAG: D-aminoacyl-tRNA deacylase [Candidatus Gracilibacteria bacterium]|jgi:D-tyrosyl-tRNA(Tyr) deacylase
MKALIQRVKNADVKVDGKVIGQVGNGLMILIGFTGTDEEKDLDFFVEKIINLRIFEDENQKMNLSLLNVKGEALIVSQFTLYADCKGGRRPSFIEAAAPEKALALYTKFVQLFKDKGIKVGEGEFGAMMDVSLVNSGPTTIILDSEQL